MTCHRINVVFKRQRKVLKNISEIYGTFRVCDYRATIVYSQNKSAAKSDPSRKANKKDDYFITKFKKTGKKQMHDNLISIDYNTCSSVAFKQKERIWYKFVFSPLDAQSSKPPKINILHMGNKKTD